MSTEPEMDESQPQPEKPSTNAARSSWVETARESLAGSVPEPVEVLRKSDEPVAEVPPAAARSVSNVRLFLILLMGCVLGTVCMVPFSVHLLGQAQNELPPGVPLTAIVVISVIVEVGLSAVLIAIGLAAGSWLDLGVPLLRAWLAGDTEASQQVRSSLLPAFGAGLVLGLAVYGMAWGMQSENAAETNRSLEAPPAWEGLLASVGAGIREEVWFRFGVMMFVAWLGTLVLRPFAGPRRTAAAPTVWVANLIAAGLFAAIHIPQAKFLVGVSLQTLVFVIFGNGLPGVVFGWLYWRRGLVAAMVAHFGLDLVIKVVLPLILGSRM